MNDTILLETFLLKTCSLDGYTILIGGICPKGKKKEAADTYSQINNIKLGFLKDEYLIDVILADLLRKLSPNWIIVLGASIFIEGVINSTGGIIGNPFEGGPGIAYKGTYEDGVRIRDNIIKDKKDNCLMIHDIIEQLDSFTNLYIVVLDGSGAISCGEIFVSDSSEKDYEVIRF